MYDILELNDKLVSELKEIARLMNIPNHDELRRQELIYKILDQQALNPSATTSIKESLKGKDFGSEKVDMGKPGDAPKKAEVEEVTVAEAASDSSKPKRKRISPVKKEG